MIKTRENTGFPVRPLILINLLEQIRKEQKHKLHDHFMNDIFAKT